MVNLVAALVPLIHCVHAQANPSDDPFSIHVRFDDQTPVTDGFNVGGVVIFQWNLDGNLTRVESRTMVELVAGRSTKDNSDVVNILRKYSPVDIPARL
jgi:hypothetical protein